MRFRCGICGYIYDEDAEGVPFDQLPDDWGCPVCGEGKEGFEPMEDDDAPATPAGTGEVAWEGEDLRQLSAGELSALCSNLARGCSKQQLARESELFAELAAYFESRNVVPDHDGIEGLTALINSDLEAYGPAMKRSAELGDRGALRVLTWSEKVSKIALSLLDRYRRDPHFLDNTDVYVCDVCGFVYIGDDPPEVCPVCKVPGFLILKIKRRS